MELVVDLQKVTVVFSCVDDVDHVTVRVAGPPDASSDDEAAVHRLADVLAATNVGELDGDDHRRAWVGLDAVRFHAAGQVDDGWPGRLEARSEETEARTGRRALEAAVRWPGDGASGLGV